MALQVSYNSQYGFTAPSAYVRIERFMGDKDLVDVQLQYFYNEASRLNSSPIGFSSHQLELPNGATMAQMYTALKELPEFSGATDC